MPDDDMTPVIRALIVTAILVFIGLIGIYWIARSEAASDSYCLISVQPFGFYEIDHLPYQEIKPLDWNNVDGFSELKQPPQLVYTIVLGICEHIIQVYRQEHDYYMMQFAQPRGQDGNPHPEHTAWIKP